MAGAESFAQQEAVEYPCTQESIVERENCRGLIDRLRWRAENREVEPVNSEREAEVKLMLAQLFQAMQQRDRKELRNMATVGAYVTLRIDYPFSPSEAAGSVSVLSEREIRQLGKNTRPKKPPSWSRWVQRLTKERASQSELLYVSTIWVSKSGIAEAQVGYGYRKNGTEFRCGHSVIDLKRNGENWIVTDFYLTEKQEGCVKA